MNMKIFGILTLVGVVVFGSIAASSYNTLVPVEEAVNVSYAQYQNQLKRQADLIPNLAEVVKSYMNMEQKTMVDTAIARAGDASKVSMKDVAGNPDLQKKLVDAQSSMGRAMVTLNAVREAYPELKSSKQVDSLMVELAGTQNRVTVARGNVQRAVNEYNLYRRQFPRVVMASILGFSGKPYYQATDEEQNAPKLNMRG